MVKNFNNDMNNTSDKIKKQKSRYIILQEDVGKSFFVYNGIKYVEIYISSDMIGRKLGEFILTRKYVVKNG